MSSLAQFRAEVAAASLKPNQLFLKGGVLSARKKLNAIYFCGATGVALLLGIVSQSLAVFAICWAGLNLALLHDGSIRPDKYR